MIQTIKIDVNSTVARNKKHDNTPTLHGGHGAAGIGYPPRGAGCNQYHINMKLNKPSRISAFNWRRHLVGYMYTFVSEPKPSRTASLFKRNCRASTTHENAQLVLMGTCLARTGLSIFLVLVWSWCLRHRSWGVGCGSHAR